MEGSSIMMNSKNTPPTDHVSISNHMFQFIPPFVLADNNKNSIRTYQHMLQNQFYARDIIWERIYSLS
jgi:hypothetical protein